MRRLIFWLAEPTVVIALLCFAYILSYVPRGYEYLKHAYSERKYYQQVKDIYDSRVQEKVHDKK